MPLGWKFKPLIPRWKQAAT